MVIIEVIACQIREHRHIKRHGEYPLLGQGMRGDFHDRFRCALAKPFCQELVQFKRLGRSVRCGQDLAGNVVLDGAYEHTLPFCGGKNGFDQESRRALAICTCDSGDGEPLRWPFVEVRAQAAESATTVGDACPGNSRARLLNGGIGDNRGCAGSNRPVDEAIAIAGLASHAEKDVTGLHLAGVVGQAGDVGVPAQGEDLRSLQHLLKSHYDDFIVRGSKDCCYVERPTKRVSFRGKSTLPSQRT